MLTVFICIIRTTNSEGLIEELAPLCYRCYWSRQIQSQWYCYFTFFSTQCGEYLAKGLSILNVWNDSTRCLTKAIHFSIIVFNDGWDCTLHCRESIQREDWDECENALKGGILCELSNCHLLHRSNVISWRKKREKAFFHNKKLTASPCGPLCSTEGKEITWYPFHQQRFGYSLHFYFRHLCINPVNYTCQYGSWLKIILLSFKWSTCLAFLDQTNYPVKKEIQNSRNTKRSNSYSLGLHGKNGNV